MIALVWLGLAVTSAALGPNMSAPGNHSLQSTELTMNYPLDNPLIRHSAHE